MNPSVYKTGVAKPKRNILRIIMFIIVTVALLGAVFSFYLYFEHSEKIQNQQQETISSLQITINSLNEQLENSADDNCISKTPTNSVIDNIEASITVGNTAVLEGYLANSINVILAASEAYGPQTKAQAIADVDDFISDAVLPWNFNLSSATLNSFEQSYYGQYFPDNAIVGMSDDGKVISFSFDGNAKIKDIFLSASNEIIVQ